VAALVSRVEPRDTVVDLVNMDAAGTASVLVQAGPFAESEITGGSYTRADPVSLGPWQGHRLPAAPPVTETPFTGAGPWLTVELPPSTRIRLRLNIRLRTRVPSYAAPWD
jgi:hypothetical protein